MSNYRRSSSNSNSSSSSSPSSSYSSNGMPHEENPQPQQALVRQRAALPTPATHAYLGEATTASTLSRKDLEVGSTVEMPILSLPGVVLFPGESLPLRLQNPAYAALAEGMLGAGGGGAGGQGQASRHLGVVNRLSSRSGGLLVRTSPVGTTAEIRSGHGGSVGEDAEAAGLAVMARGRHRFRLLEDLGWRRGVRYWKVMISPDLCPGPLRAPLPRAFRDARGSRHWAMAIPRFVVDSNSPVGLATRAACLLRKQRGPESPTEAAVADAAALGEASLPATTEASGGVSLQVEGASISLGDHDDVDERSEGGGNAGIPAEERMSFDGEILEKEEEEWMLGGNGRGKVNPTLFSFWLAANLPLDDDARQELLVLDSVVMRLRLEIKHLELSRRRPLCCAGCGTGVAWEGDVFTLPGAEGVVGAYVNADGYVHQTVTVRDARNLALMDEPEVRDTWFPGYGWIPAYCAGCLHHLGWRFVAVDQGTNATSISQPITSAPSRSRGSGTTGGVSQAVGAAEELGPPSFYGLRRPALTLQQEEHRGDGRRRYGRGSSSL